MSFMIKLPTAAGPLLIVLGVMDYLKYHGFWGHVPLTDCWQNVVVIGLGVIIWCFAALLTSLVAIEKKLHE
jgi:hypothetical protein